MPSQINLKFPSTFLCPLNLFLFLRPKISTSLILRMNEKTGSIVIDIIETKLEPLWAKSGGKLGNSSTLLGIRSVWNFCKEDRNRLLFSFKVGLAVVLVSLLILLQAPYDVFGSNIIWAIITVAIMFEYTVGLYIYYRNCAYYILLFFSFFFFLFLFRFLV